MYGKSCREMVAKNGRFPAKTGGLESLGCKLILTRVKSMDVYFLHSLQTPHIKSVLLKLYFGLDGGQLAGCKFTSGELSLLFRSLLQVLRFPRGHSRTYWLPKIKSQFRKTASSVLWDTNSH